MRIRQYSYTWFRIRKTEPAVKEPCHSGAMGYVYQEVQRGLVRRLIVPTNVFSCQLLSAPGVLDQFQSRRCMETQTDLFYGTYVKLPIDRSIIIQGDFQITPIRRTIWISTYGCENAIHGIKIKLTNNSRDNVLDPEHVILAYSAILG